MQLRATQKSIACPTQPKQNTKVFASRIQNPTRAQVCSTKDNATKSDILKNATKQRYKNKVLKIGRAHV